MSEALNIKLHDYQKDIINTLVNSKRKALFVEMGLGKTAIMLGFIHEMIKKDPDFKVLILAPKALTNLVWQVQINTILPSLKYYIINRESKNQQHLAKRTEEYKKAPPHNVCILSSSLTYWFFSNKFHLNYKALVIDESTIVKSHNTLIFNTLKKNLDPFEYRYIMTGTPCPNGYLDLWAQIYILDEGARLGRYLTHYRNEYFYKSQWNRYSWYLQPEANLKIDEKIKDLVISKDTKSAGITLPDYIESIVCENLPPRNAKEYRQLKKTCVLTLQDPLETTTDPVTNEVQIVAKNQALVIDKLLQYCSGAVYKDDGSYIRVHDIKLEMLRDVFLQYPGKILLAYNYIHEGTRILNRFPHEVIIYKGDTALIHEWQAGNTPRVLASHPLRLGYGLNLQHDACTVVWYGFTWNLALYQQFNKRLHRQGQEHPVNIVHLAVGDVEFKLLNKLKEKEQTQHALLQYLQTSMLEPPIPGFVC